MQEHITTIWAPIGAMLLASVLAPVFSNSRSRIPPSAWAVVPALCFLFYLSKAGDVWAGTVFRQDIPWADSIGFSINLWLSPVGLLLSLLVTGVGTLVFLYAAAYLQGSNRLGRFLGILFLFAGAMLGVATSENLLILFIFWELTSISSYLLIGYSHEKEDSRKAALDALLITSMGGLALLAGIILLGEAGGSYIIHDLIAAKGVILAHPFYPAILVCVLLGAATKSAQFPFHFWLPGAMAAPAPVSAYLHSATMVKAGIFLLAILHPVLSGSNLWHYSLITLGAVTMTWGALVAMVQTDLKRLLAFSTISALGTLTMLLGMENKLAIKAAVIFFVVHALYKGSLFMVAGAVEKGSGTRDISQLRGLLRTYPRLGIGAVAAACSMSGLPPFVGFISKELLYEVKLEAVPFGYLLLVCGFVANAANVLVALKVGLLPFFGAAPDTAPNLKPRQVGFWVGPLVLGIASLGFGLFPGTLLEAPVEAWVNQIAASDITIKLKLWHGFNLVLLLSTLTIATGVSLFLIRRHLWRLADRIRETFGWNATWIFRNGLYRFIEVAGRLTRTIQSGNLSRSLMIIFITASLVLGITLQRSGFVFSFPVSSGFRLEVLVIVIFTSLTSVLLVKATHQMTLILLLGCVGFSIAGLYAVYGAPDLAITQILVETLTLLLFALALYGLPGMTQKLERKRARRALAVSLLVGVGFALLTLKAFNVQISDAVSGDLAALSLSEAYGRNVVNVILVDFRALDTLGEITVLMIAALGVFAMLGKEIVPDGYLGPERSPVLAASARYTAPLMLAFSIYLLLRGHNEPGGGFIGGLAAAMASILLHLARPDRHFNLFRKTPSQLMVAGLLMALVSGLPGLVADDAFLQAWWGGTVTLPVLGKIKFGTPLLFDIGVYLVVTGVVLTLYRTMVQCQMAASVPDNNQEASP